VARFENSDLLTVFAESLSGCGKHPRLKVELPISGKVRLDGDILVDTHEGKLTPGIDVHFDSPLRSRLPGKQ
jgi:hypothetical protein